MCLSLGIFGCSEPRDAIPVAEKPSPSVPLAPVLPEEEANPDVASITTSEPKPTKSPSSANKSAEGAEKAAAKSSGEPASSATSSNETSPPKSPDAPKSPDDDPAKVEPKPESEPAKKPAPKPETKPATEIDYFRQLPTVIDLPSPEEGAAGKAVSLGAVTLPAEVICIVHLLGGDAAYRGGRKTFRCEEESSQNSVRQWRIELVSGGTPLTIARLELRDAKLWFTWLPEAAEDSASASLGNCVLRLNAGSKKKLICLRKPVHAPAMTVAFGRTTGQWELENLPRPEKVKVELRLIADRKLRYRFIGPSTLSVSETETSLAFGLGKGADQGVKLKLDLSLSKTLKITSQPQLQLATQPKPVALTAEFMKRTEAELKRNLTVLEKQLETIEAMQSAAKNSSTKFRPNGPDPREGLRAQIKQFHTAQEQLEQAHTLEPELAKAKLQVRVFYEAEEALVDLLVASGGPEKK